MTEPAIRNKADKWLDLKHNCRRIFPTNDLEHDITLRFDVTFLSRVALHETAFLFFICIEDFESQLSFNRYYMVQTKIREATNRVVSSIFRCASISRLYPCQ